jgi:hypothetical protein
MELTRNTAPGLLGIQEQLVKLESMLNSPEGGLTRETYQNMTAEAFWETGASGRRYSREAIIDALLLRHSAPPEDCWQAEDFCCQMVAADLFLLTYTLRQGPRVTRRMTLWRAARDRWLAVYHQGTIVEGASGGSG